MYQQPERFFPMHGRLAVQSHERSIATVLSADVQSIFDLRQDSGRPSPSRGEGALLGNKGQRLQMNGRNAGNRHDLFRILNQESTGCQAEPDLLRVNKNIPGKARATLLRFDEGFGGCRCGCRQKWVVINPSTVCSQPRYRIYSAAGGRVGAGKDAASSGVAPADADSLPPGILYTQ